jgi:hypothetical protein
MPPKKSTAPSKTYDRLAALPQRLCWQEWDFRWVRSAEEEYWVGKYEQARELLRFVERSWTLPDWKPAAGKVSSRDAKLCLRKLGRLLDRDSLSPLEFDGIFFPGQVDQVISLLDLVVRFNGPIKEGFVPRPAFVVRENIRILIAQRGAEGGLNIRHKRWGQPEPELEVWQVPTSFEFSVPQYPMMDIGKAVSEFRKWAEASHMFDLDRPNKGGRPSLSALTRLSYYRYTQGRKELKLHGQFGDLFGAKPSEAVCLERFAHGESLYVKDGERSRRSMSPFWSKAIKDVEDELRPVVDDLAWLLGVRPPRASSRR